MGLCALEEHLEKQYGVSQDAAGSEERVSVPGPALIGEN